MPSSETNTICSYYCYSPFPKKKLFHKKPHVSLPFAYPLLKFQGTLTQKTHRTICKPPPRPATSTLYMEFRSAVCVQWTETRISRSRMMRLPPHLAARWNVYRATIQILLNVCFTVFEWCVDGTWQKYVISLSWHVNLFWLFRDRI